MAAAAAAAAICINTDRQKMVRRQGKGFACGGTRQGAKGKCVLVHSFAVQSLVLINKGESLAAAHAASEVFKL